MNSFSVTSPVTRLVVLVVEGLDGAPERRVPEAVVGQLGEGGVELRLRPRRQAEGGEALEVLVRDDERDGRGALVRLATLDAHHPVLHQIDAAHAVQARELAHPGDEPRRRQLLAVDADRVAGLEADPEETRLGGRILPGLRPGERLLGGLGVRVLEDAALDAPAPEVLVDAERALSGGGDGDAVLGRVVHRLVAADVPLALGGDDLQRRVRAPSPRGRSAPGHCPCRSAPWATAVAPYLCAMSTRCLAISGRLSAALSG